MPVLSSCAKQTPPANLAPPADLFARPAQPRIGSDALTSEKAYEAWREDTFDWGKALDARLYVACRWFADAGVAVTCGEAPTALRK